jgi:hypothetical protein
LRSKCHSLHLHLHWHVWIFHHCFAFQHLSLSLSLSITPNVFQFFWWELKTREALDLYRLLFLCRLLFTGITSSRVLGFKVFSRRNVRISIQKNGTNEHNCSLNLVKTLIISRWQSWSKKQSW